MTATDDLQTIVEGSRTSLLPVIAVRCLMRWEYSDALIKANNLPPSYWAKNRKEQYRDERRKEE
jgi:hypothetical protein